MRFVLIVCLVLITSMALFAQGGGAPTVSLNVSDVDITEAFASLSQQAGISILGDATAKGKVTCSLSGLSAEQTLDTLCKMNRLEWRKAYTSAAEGKKLSADEMFKALDVLSKLGTTSLICTDPAGKSPVVFIPDAGSVDTSALAGSLKLKEVYIVRAIPTETAASAKKSDKAKTAADQKKSIADKDLSQTAYADPATAARDLYGAMDDMSVEQQYQTLDDLKHEFYKNMTPQERRDFKDYLQRRAKEQKQQKPQQPNKPSHPRKGK